MAMSLQLLIYQIIKFIPIISIILILNSSLLYAADKKKSPGHTTHPNLYITSDSLIIDRIKETVEYSGKVAVHFNDAVLRTDKLYIIYKVIGNNKTVDYIFIPGKLTVERKSNDELLFADSAKYFLDNKQLTLLGNVILQREGSILKTNKLIYYIDLKTINSMKVSP